MNIKIADFGFANYYDRINPLKTFCGSAPYAAPEVFRGQKYFGPEIDLWSMGIILYALVTGSLPFNSENIYHLKQLVLSGKYAMPINVSSECQDIISKLIVVNVEDRYTLEQVKQHQWFKLHNCNFDSTVNMDQKSQHSLSNIADNNNNDELHLLSNEDAGQSNETHAKQQALVQQDGSNAPIDCSILRIMNSFGLDIQSTINVIFLQFSWF